MLFRLLLLALLFSGCQTAQQRSQQLVQQRVGELKHLSQWNPTWCQVDTRLTQPAMARYREMFPLESEVLAQETWGYTWKSRKSTCEITPLDSSPVTRNHQGFLETSICLLLQAHYVNSPFDELDLNDIQAVGPLTQIRAGANPDLGIFLPRDSMTVETRTKSRGVLHAIYDNQNGPWLPRRLEQRHGATSVVVDEIEYDPDAGSAARPMLKSFWISVGAEQVFRHSQVQFSGCRPL